MSQEVPIKETGARCTSATFVFGIGFSLMSESRGPEVAHTTGSHSLVNGFTLRLQELATINSFQQLTGAINTADYARYELELQNFHKLDAESVAAHYASSTTNGLSHAESTLRLKRDGLNLVSPPRDTPVFFKFLLSFLAGFQPLLWVATFFVFLSWEPFGTPPSNVYSLYLAIVLLVVIVVSSVFSFSQELLTARTLAGFQNLIPNSCIVIRDSIPARIPAANLVVGDVVQLETGGRVPADMRIISSSNLKIDKSILTGESEPVRVAAAPITRAEVPLLAASNMAFMGCGVVEGGGTGVVIASGSNNQVGKIAAQTVQPQRLTTLQVEVNRFVVVIAAFAIVTGVVVISVWGGWLNVQHYGYMSTSTMIANAISVIVAFVPEGLPLALTIGLTIIARRLCAASFVLVKQLGTIETLGSVSIIASDKTGTLTQNKMTVVRLVTVASSTYTGASQSGSDVYLGTSDVVKSPLLEATASQLVTLSGPRDWIPLSSSTSPTLTTAIRIAALCNPARFQSKAASRRGSRDTTASEPIDGPATATTASLDEEAALEAEEKRIIVGGNGIDKALLAWAATHGDPATTRAQHVQLADVPFSSATKISAGVWESDTSRFVAVKGAPEFVLDRCASALDANGNVVPMTSQLFASITAAIDALSRKGQRIIALGERPLSYDADTSTTASFPRGFHFSVEPEPNFPMEGLIFVGAVAVTDPPRPGAIDAVRTLRKAGIKVAMITGDAATTATAIAAEVGIISMHDADGNVMAPPDTLASAGFLRKQVPPANYSNAPKGRDGSRMLLAEVANPIVPPRIANDVPSAIAPSAVAVATMETHDRKSQSIVVQGPELKAMPAAAWDFIFSHDELVFARTTPEQKLQIVRECSSRGHRVGVTGDGVNDAPALKAADVGIAMNGGADVAREAAAIILLKDDFTAIPEGVREGRLIFTNLRKVIAYQIAAGCWSELLPVLACFFLGMPQPLSSFLMIVISCITDVFNGIALMYEPAEDDTMLARPRDVKRDHLVSGWLILYSYGFYGNLQSLAAFITWFYYMSSRGPTGLVPNPIPAAGDPAVANDYPAGYTPGQLTFAWNWGADTGALGADEASALATSSSIFFLVLVVSQLGHVLSIRKRIPYFAGLATARSWSEVTAVIRKGIGIRWPIVGGWVVSIIAINIFNEIPAVQLVCGTAHLPAVYWGIAIAWSVAIFSVAEIRKWIIYLYPHGCLAKTAW